jgi:hypothetical protein
MEERMRRREAELEALRRRRGPEIDVHVSVDIPCRIS